MLTKLCSCSIKIHVSWDINPGISVPLEGLGSQAVISNQFDIGVRSNPVDDQDENNKIGNASISRSRTEDVAH